MAQTFIDLNTVSDYLDLTQWDEAPHERLQCGRRSAVRAHLHDRPYLLLEHDHRLIRLASPRYPKTLDDLLAAGKAFQEKLGDDYYPLHLGAYDRMILMVFYLESKYGKDLGRPRPPLP